MKNLYLKPWNIRLFTGLILPQAVLLVFGLLLASCSGMPKLDDIGKGLFGKKEAILPGKREAALKSGADLQPDEKASSMSIKLPAVLANSAWPQPGGNSASAIGHPAYRGALKIAWSASAGTGTTSDGQLIASPIAWGGRIYTLDSRGVVTAFSLSGGSIVWHTDLTPPGEEGEDGYGGGIAIDNGRLFAATGFGVVVALDARSGKKLWSRDLGIPIRLSPLAAGGRVFVTTTEGRFYCLSGENGEDIWSQRGIPDRASIISNLSPAASGKIVIAPFTSGEIDAYDIKSGRGLWRDSLAGPRSNSVMGKLTDPGRPVIYKGVVYAVGNSGKMIAASLKDGMRIWSKPISSTQMPWVAGNMVYVLDSSGRAVGMRRKDGAIVWVRKLPDGGKWRGPLLAGDKLWAISSNGLMVGIDPLTGNVRTQRDLGYVVHIAPIAASGHIYILTDSAKLLALN